MSQKRILLMYISENSGHHRAALAVESAIREGDPQAAVSNINSVNYTNPILEKIINRTYLEIIKRTPEVWEYLYDNPRIVKGTQHLRALIHRYNSEKLKTLLDELKPTAVACTQAFPCGMIADYKKSLGINIPLMGILTDYAPHSYWIYDNVDVYVVPAVDTGHRLVENGIEPKRVQSLGIPVEPKFSKSHDRNELFRHYGLDPSSPVILMMGGGQGLGPMKEMIAVLDRIKAPLQIIVICGLNKSLFKWCRRRFRKKLAAFSYTDEIDKLMEISTLIVTKAGGLTTAEALAKKLPMILLSPLPGQETMNTRFLTKHGMAVKAATSDETMVLLQELLNNPTKIQLMRQAAAIHAKPDSAKKIAQILLGMS